MPENLAVNVMAVNGSLVISGPAPWVEISGDWDPATGTFTNTGRGTVAGFSNIAVSFDGTVTEDGVEGELTMGAEGGLPTGHPARYLVIGEFPADLFEPPPTDTASPTTEPPSPTPAEEQIGAFAAEFAELVGAGSGEFAFERLHPVVLTIFREELCHEFVDREIVLIRD